MMLSLFFVVRPSRSITSIYVPKPDAFSKEFRKNIPNYRNLLIVECGRFFGTAPTYYIFDGKEEDRILAALGQLQPFLYPFFAFFLNLSLHSILLKSS